jgi:modulator of FtsH protease HflK
LGLFLLGRFSATIARLQDNRLLRPSGGYLLLGAYLSFLATAGIAAVTLAKEFPHADLYVAKGLAALLGLVALETLLTLVLEIYRPRVKGKVGRPLYESRVVGLLGQPEGLITTAAQALDYQFGFKVSDTWAYRFLEQRLGLLLLLQLAVLLVSTCFVVVEAGEQALLERFGRPVGKSALNPGLHVKLPWPIDSIHRYRTDRVQTINVGFAPEEDEHAHTSTVVWTAGHGKEDNFLVANRELVAVETDGPNRKAPPVSLLTVSIPVQYQVTNITEWVYGHEDGANLLQQISTREVVRYLVSADFNEVMSSQRLAAGNALRMQIQAAAEAAKLGVNILFVGLQDIHPPVKVAPEYEKVVGAFQQKQAKILIAESDAVRTNALALAHAFTATNSAAAERHRLQSTALARAAAFTNQIAAFNAAPLVYKQRAYLKALPKAIAGARKVVILTTNTEPVIQFDLQQKVADEFFQNFTPPTTR